MKERVGDGLCDACTALNAKRFGISDPNRRATRASTGESHDSLSDCGCSSGYFMNFSSLTPALMTARCPVSSRIELWAAHANLSRYAAGCCAGGPCNGRSQWLCVERACREEYLAESLAVDDDPFEQGRCVACPPEQLNCNDSFASTRTLRIQPGYWRTNELSTDLRECFPRAACVGDERADASRRTDALCRNAHWGPLCAVCFEHHFKNRRGLCVSCESLGDVALKMYAVVGATLVFIFVFAYWRLRKTAARLLFRGEQVITHCLLF